MPMNDAKLIMFRIPPTQIPAKVGDVMDLAIDYSGNFELFQRLGDGWQIVNHSMQPIPNGEWLLSLFIQRSADYS